MEPFKRHCKPTPQTVTLLTHTQCYGCGWKGQLFEAKQSIFLDWRPGMLIPASKGGNGKNYRCPQCGGLIFYTRNDNNGKIIAPQGHQYHEIL